MHWVEATAKSQPPLPQRQHLSMHAATSPEGTVRLATALVLPEPALEVANSSMPTRTTFSKVIQDSGRPPAEGKKSPPTEGASHRRFTRLDRPLWDDYERLFCYRLAGLMGLVTAGQDGPSWNGLSFSQTLLSVSLTQRLFSAFSHSPPSGANPIWNMV